MKRWIYLVHRWLGIGLCLVMALWFLSGIVMLYVGYPKLTHAERMRGLPALDAAACCVPLPQALAAAGLGQPDARNAAIATWRLTSVAGAPVYVFSEGSRHAVAVDARSGQRVTGVDPPAALAAARHFAAGAPAHYRDTVVEDAWTHSRALDAHRPLHVVAVQDDASRWLYVSGRTGEVVRDATFTERTWGWLGAWLHWLYIFRGGAVDAWWADIVIYLSLAGGVVGLAGLVVGVWRWRFGRPYRSGRRTPYTGRMARWHHVLGLAGGVLAFTWVVSGLLSMNPWKVFDAGGPRPDRLAYAGGPLQPAQALPAEKALALLQARGVTAKEIEWRRIGGVHHVLAHGDGAPRLLGEQGVLDDGVPRPQWQAAAAALLPHARIVEQQLLTAYDSYYVAREPHTMTGHRERPLPVWRLRFDDANHTWATIDPATGELLQLLNRHRRVDRWLFAFLHSFDLPALLATRPLWDAWMVGFSLAGLGLSLTGAVTGYRRVRRRLARRATPAAGASATGA